MEASASLLFMLFGPFVAALLLTLGYLSMRLRQANRRLARLYETIQDHRHLILSHLAHLEEQLQQMPDLALMWDPDHKEWQLKGRLGAEGLIAYLARCRDFARGSLCAGEDRKRVDVIVGLSLQRVVGRDSGYHEQLCKLLTDEERARWLP